MTASSFDVQFGIRHAWEDGEPQFGISAEITTNNGVMVTMFKLQRRLKILCPSAHDCALYDRSRLGNFS